MSIITRYIHDGKGGEPIVETFETDDTGYALSELKRNDAVAARCFKEGKNYPNEWKLYDQKLRDIVNGQKVEQLPIKPAYP